MCQHWAYLRGRYYNAAFSLCSAMHKAEESRSRRTRSSGEREGRANEYVTVLTQHVKPVSDVILFMLCDVIGQEPFGALTMIPQQSRL